MNQVKSFEDQRWSRGPQPLVFRHTAALGFIKPGQKLLDIGCGDGLFMTLAAAKGAVCSGVDISPKAVELTQRKNPGTIVVLADVTTERLPFPEGAFDIVTALDVVEHVLQPEVALDEIHRLTNDKAVICVPNFSSLPSRLQCLLGKVPENNKAKKGHVFWFNWHIIQKFIRESGFEIIEVKRSHQGMSIPLLGSIVGWLSEFWPNLFALSFVVLLRKVKSA